MAEKRQLSDLGPVGLLTREQRTLRLAVEVLARYANRLNEALFLMIKEVVDFIVLCDCLPPSVNNGSATRAPQNSRSTRALHPSPKAAAA
jgi:hypothetical protein